MEMDSSDDCITGGPKHGVENRRYADKSNSNRNERNDQAVIVRRRVRERFRQSQGKATMNHNGEARSTPDAHRHHRDNNTKTTRTKNQITRLQYHRHQHHLVMLELKIDALRRRSSTIGRRYVHDQRQASSDNAAASRTILSSSKGVSESPQQVSSLRTLPSSRETVPVSGEEDTCTSLHSKASDEESFHSQRVSLSGRDNDVNETKYSDSMESVSRHVSLPSKGLDLEKSKDVLPNQNGYHIDDDALAIANARRSIEEAKMFLAARKLMKRSKEEVKQNTGNATTELDCFTTPVDQLKHRQSQESGTQKISFPLPHSEEDDSSSQDFVQFELSFPLDDSPVSASQSEEPKADSMNDNQDDNVANNSCKGSESSQSGTETRNVKADVTLEQDYKRNHYSIKKLFSCSSSGSRKNRAHHHNTLDKLDLRINGSSTHSSSRGNTAEVSDQLTNSTSQDGGSDYVRGHRKIKHTDTHKKSGKSTATKWYIRQDEDGQETRGSKPVVRRSSNGSFFFGRKNASRAVSTTGQDPTEPECVMDMIFFDVVHQQNTHSDLEVVPEDQSLCGGQ